MEKSEFILSSFTDLRLNNTMDMDQAQNTQNSSHTENNLNKRKNSSKSFPTSNLPYGKHLEAWLDNSMKGFEVSSSDITENLCPPIFMNAGMSSSQKNNNHTESLSLPPHINYLDAPTSSSTLFLQQQSHNRNMTNNDSADFVSLPPRIFSHSTNKNMTPHSLNDFFNYSKVLSDPGINDSSDSESKNSCNKSKMQNNEPNLPGGSADGNNNLILMLLKEMNKLHETNKKICRNLHETKVEMEALKHSPYWGLNHRRDSLSGLSTSSQPVGMRYNLGIQSPAPTYHSQGNYTPGIVTDVIREVRELSRVREEALLDRVKTMIEERSWSINESNFRLVKESEDVKKQVHSIKSDMNQIAERMFKLENEVLSLKSQMMHNSMLNYSHQEANVAYANPSNNREALIHNNKLKKNNLHINYGRINNEEEIYMNCYSEMENDPRYNNRSFNENCYPENNGRYMQKNGVAYDEEIQEEANDQMLLLEKDTLKLRRELQDALASKQQSENRITALENIVTTLKEHVPTSQTGKIPEYYYRNSKSPAPPPPLSPNPQRAAQIQCISPKHVIMSPNTINLSGPVTDL